MPSMTTGNPSTGGHTATDVLLDGRRALNESEELRHRFGDPGALSVRVDGSLIAIDLDNGVEAGFVDALGEAVVDDARFGVRHRGDVGQQLFKSRRVRGRHREVSDKSDHGSVYTCAGSPMT